MPDPREMGEWVNVVQLYEVTDEATLGEFPPDPNRVTVVFTLGAPGLQEPFSFINLGIRRDGAFRAIAGISSGAPSATVRIADVGPALQEQLYLFTSEGPISVYVIATTLANR